MSAAPLTWSPPELTGDLDTILSWADEIRLDETCGPPTTCAPTPTTPGTRRAPRSKFGRQKASANATAPSICSWAMRKNIIQSFILSDDEAVKQQALADLLKVRPSLLAALRP